MRFTKPWRTLVGPDERDKRLSVLGVFLGTAGGSFLREVFVVDFLAQALARAVTPSESRSNWACNGELSIHALPTENSTRYTRVPPW